ncbi:hypothetical protein CEXT_282701 [Caerostris extrusa]|uniref:Uncharacterized protein n=1 Tax=Caerostris extrusa TaxID=172846 RepID=A0AAV4WD25_CAEEX|nr:hypothetical protein CEXT_282701 [Caerostris extrusa]
MLLISFSNSFTSSSVKTTVDYSKAVGQFRFLMKQVRSRVTVFIHDTIKRNKTRHCYSNPGVETGEFIDLGPNPDHASPVRQQTFQKFAFDWIIKMKRSLSAECRERVCMQN